MRNLLNILFSTARAKFMPLWIKLRMWTTPTFLKTKVLTRVREFFSKLLDVRPRHKKDYYSILGWLVSKRLAFALVVLLGIVSAMYISAMLPQGLLGGSSGGVRTYGYRSIPLRFYSGTVNITARGGYVAYTGQVDKGAANGEGSLYAADGSLVYEGAFADNMYNGQGKQYYPSGVPQYVGSFTDNEYNGQGSYYRPSGILEYQGDYVFGVRTGSGTLYDSVGDQIFQGSFLNNEIVFQDFLDRPTDEVSGLYSGETTVYQSDSEYCVAMPEINGVYAVKDGSTTLENQWTVEQIYVLGSSVPLESGNCETVRELTEVMGPPLYYGTIWVDLPETVAWNMVAQEKPDELEEISISTQATFENVLTVDSYDKDYQLYLYTYEYNGLLYHFYFTGAGESEFIMYMMEKA